MELQVHKSKWGYYPCDYQTYIKLKELNKLVTKSLSLRAEWYRWIRKAPHNRVLRRTIRKCGQVISREVVGPRPEPEFNSLFLEKKKYITNWPRSGSYNANGVEEESLEFTDLFFQIQEDYRNARYPKADEANVEPLNLPLEQIDNLIKDTGIQLA